MRLLSIAGGSASGRLQSRRRDAPSVYGPPKTLYNRFIRWGKAGVFDRIFAPLAAMSEATDTVMVDATHLKAHRMAASLLKKGMFTSPYRAHRGRLDGKPIDIAADRRPGKRLSRRSDVLPALPPADVLIADRGYDSDWFRGALAEKGH